MLGLDWRNQMTTLSRKSRTQSSKSRPLKSDIAKNYNALDPRIHAEFIDFLINRKLDHAIRNLALHLK
jgi:hypothetical protein